MAYNPSSPVHNPPPMNEIQKKIVTCLSIDCPERKSLCCGAGCTNGEKGEPHFVCSKCRKEYVGGECRHQPHQGDGWDGRCGSCNGPILKHHKINQWHGFTLHTACYGHAKQTERLLAALLTSARREELEWVLGGFQAADGYVDLVVPEIVARLKALSK